MMNTLISGGPLIGVIMISLCLCVADVDCSVILVEKPKSEVSVVELETATNDSLKDKTDVGVNRLKTTKNFCKCTSIFDKCPVEVLQETVTPGKKEKPCLENQRYCCQRRTAKEESNLMKLVQTAAARISTKPSHGIILRDEVFNMATSNDTIEEPEVKKTEAIISPHTLSSILSLLTQGFKFLSNFF